MERNTASVRAADERLDALLGHRGAATASLLFALSDGAKRFGVLRSQMGRMSQKTLVAELRWNASFSRRSRRAWNIR